MLTAASLFPLAIIVPSSTQTRPFHSCQTVTPLLPSRPGITIFSLFSSFPAPSHRPEPPSAGKRTFVLVFPHGPLRRATCHHTGKSRRCLLLPSHKPPPHPLAPLRAPQLSVVSLFSSHNPGLRGMSPFLFSSPYNPYLCFFFPPQFPRLCIHCLCLRSISSFLYLNANEVSLSFPLLSSTALHPLSP